LVGSPAQASGAFLPRCAHATAECTVTVLEQAGNGQDVAWLRRRDGMERNVALAKIYV
jgi:hypothetical protein